MSLPRARLYVSGIPFSSLGQMEVSFQAVWGDAAVPAFVACQGTKISHHGHKESFSVLARTAMRRDMQRPFGPYPARRPGLRPLAKPAVSIATESAGSSTLPSVCETPAGDANLMRRVSA